MKILMTIQILNHNMGSGLNKIQHRENYINRNEYLLFKNKYPDTKITYEIFINTLKESTSAIKEHILTNPLGFKLPFNIGYIAVDKFKAKAHYVAVDWVNTRRLGRRIPLINLHSFGYMYKVKFYPNMSIKPLKNYEMEAHRKLNRSLGQNILNNTQQYISIDRNYFSKRFHIDKYLNNDN